jgi:hypothetical protein
LKLKLCLCTVLLMMTPNKLSEWIFYSRSWRIYIMGKALVMESPSPSTGLLWNHRQCTVRSYYNHKLTRRLVRSPDVKCCLPGTTHRYRIVRCFTGYMNGYIQSTNQPWPTCTFIFLLSFNLNFLFYLVLFIFRFSFSFTFIRPIHFSLLINSEFIII